MSTKTTLYVRFSRCCLLLLWMVGVITLELDFQQLKNCSNSINNHIDLANKTWNSCCHTFTNKLHHTSNVHYGELHADLQVFWCWCRHTTLNATIFTNFLTPKAKLTIVIKQRTYHDAPTTDREIESPIPRDAHINGEVWSRNLTRRWQFFKQNSLAEGV